MIHAKRALLASGWAENTRIEIEHGVIQALHPSAKPMPQDSRVDVLLPALSNLHSHSFQRAMAGMTETRHAGRDSFWTWRKLMYRFMDNLTPDQLEAIAALAFMEMQEAGFASVAEFHYVHHQAGGAPYDDISELSQRIFAAALDTGIGLTHLPVLYSYGGAGRQALNAGQLRFGNDVTRFQTLVQRVGAGLRALPDDMRLGIAPHSLRATSPDDLSALLSSHTEGPVHIHAAEQQKEVADITDWLGQRPIEWLLSTQPVGPDWCVIHATHMTEGETIGLARSGAVAGLCPVTEANLGDGIFNGPAYLKAGGTYGVGTDSNIAISGVQELRMLEYSQRLQNQARNLMVSAEGSVGQALYTSAARGGAQALGRDCGEIAVGRLADLVGIDGTDPTLCARAPSHLLDGLVFASRTSVITDLWSAGRHCVLQGRHRARDQIVARYRKAISHLLES